MPAKKVKEGGTVNAAKNAYGKKIVKLSKAYAVGQRSAKQELKKGMASPKTDNKIGYYLGMSMSEYPGVKPVQRKMIKAANSGRNSVLAAGGKTPLGVKPLKSKNVLGKKRAPKVAAMARITKVLGSGTKAKPVAKKSTPAQKARKTAKKYM
jgi:hypothetical protein